jgi:hypothetical protein
MGRFYMGCATCRWRRMHLIGESTADNEVGKERYYRCPNCGAEWTYGLDRNIMLAGVPDEVRRRSKPK